MKAEIGFSNICLQNEPICKSFWHDSYNRPNAVGNMVDYYTILQQYSNVSRKGNHMWSQQWVQTPCIKQKNEHLMCLRPFHRYTAARHSIQPLEQHFVEYGFSDAHHATLGMCTDGMF